MQSKVSERSPSHTRLDAIERVKGIAKYTGDWHVDDMLYARIITSTVPHGTVKNVDTSRAMEFPGVLDVVTCLDDRTIWYAGEREHERRVFTEHVRFIGDCIGAVTARSRQEARRAADAVDVEYEEKAATFNIQSSLGSEEDKIWDDGNTIPTIKYGYGEPKKSFENADIVMENHYSTSRVANVPLEPAISLAWWEGEKLTVVAATQSIHGCRKGIAKDLGMPEEDVRVITYYKGGGFGNKASSMSYDLVAAICARRTGKPVMVEYSREDEFVSVHGRWSSEQNLKVAASGDGHILAMDLDAKCDIGAYTRHMKIGRFVEGAENYYSTDSWKAEVTPVYTNTPATGHMRAPPGPQSCFSAETMVDELAFKLGMNPLDIRLKNRIVKPHGGVAFTSNGLEDCIRIGSEQFKWRERWSPPPEELPEEGVVTGVGMAIASWETLLGHGEASVNISSDGTVRVTAGVIDIGTGAKTAMAMIAAKEIGVLPEQVELVWGDTAATPYSIGESGSRTTTFTGYAVKEAAREVKEELLKLASDYLDVPAKDLEVRGREIANRIQDKPLCEIFDVLSSAGREEIGKKASTDRSLPEGTSMLAFTAHFAEVSVDVETGEVKVTDYVAVHDSGEIINRLTAESQVQGGIVMGLGMALTEKILISDDNGTIENPSMLMYRVPNTVHIPDIKVIFTETEDPFGPKSLGEIPLVPVPAAVGNAIFNATGVRLRNLPFSRDELVSKILAGSVNTK